MIYIAATHNENKIKEFDRILKPLGISVISAEECGEKLPEVNETGKTFAENAELKAKSACEATGMPAIADDSGLMVDALGGRPGVYSARYAGEGASDEEKIEKLMIELKDTPDGQRTAHFVCAICCYFPDGSKIEVEGSCDGSIGFAPRGNNGFGYDPIFFTDDNKTFAELSSIHKDAMSHSGKALRALAEKLSEKLKEKKF